MYIEKINEKKSIYLQRNQIRNMKKCKDCMYMHIHPISVPGHTFYQCVYNIHTSLVLPEFECNNFQRKPEQMTIIF